MAETENISKMADKISKEIFSVFGWEKIGPKNVNWECVYPKEHLVSTHPSDVVFWYRHPYHNSKVYLNCDLKSYARKSIHKASIGGAINTLCKAVECAQVSQKWQDLFLHKGVTPEITGLLFVYNHDGGYDSEFRNLLQMVDDTNFKIGSGCKVFIMSPFDVCYINTIANYILRMRGIGEIPGSDNCSFFYPDLFRKKSMLDSNASATIEMLLGPWQILKYKNGNSNGMVIYVKSHGETIEEFMYVIDYLIHYQVLGFMDSVCLKFPYESKISASNFEKAIIEYARQQGEDTQEYKILIERLSGKIRYESITNVISSFSEIAIGMEG